jgi:hypothetical protein
MYGIAIAMENISPFQYYSNEGENKDSDLSETAGAYSAIRS